MNPPSPEEKLRSLRGRRVVLVGIGHPLRGDDAAGITLARRLRRRGRTAALVAGTAPENFSRAVVSLRPEVVLLADAARLGQASGDWALLTRREIAGGAVSTHDFSPAVLMEFLERETAAEVFLLGIQPRRRGWGERLSAEVSSSVSRLEELLYPILAGSGLNQRKRGGGA